MQVSRGGKKNAKDVEICCPLTSEALLIKRFWSKFGIEASW